jgi:hypothetical protein
MKESCTSPEMALLLQCAGATGEQSYLETATLAGAVESWEIFLELASGHAIVPLVDQQLARIALGTVPPAIAASIGVAARESAVQSLRLSGDLVAVLSALSAAAIDAIPFKGPTLATLIYGNLSLRQFEDLDILVHREEVERSRSVLLSLGYVAVLPYDKDQRASMQLSGHHEQHAHPVSGTTIELHWSLNNRSLTHDSFEHHWWESRQGALIGGASMRTLGVEQMLLYLCMHGGKHSWGRLSWLCDLQRALVAYPDADWDRVWALAAESGSVRMVGIGLTLVDTLFEGAALTEPAASGRGCDMDANRVSTLIVNRFRNSDSSLPSPDFKVQLRSRERRRDQLRYVWHVFATPHPADVSLLGLPRALHGMYFILRPLRLTIKYLGRRLRFARAA